MAARLMYLLGLVAGSGSNLEDLGLEHNLDEIKIQKSKLPPKEQAKANVELINAAGQGDFAEVNRLLAIGANAKAKNEFGETALHVAAIKGTEDVVEELIRAGADVNAQTNSGQAQKRPPMQWFIQMNNDASLEKNMGALLKAGADPNLQNELGQNTLDISIMMGKSREKITAMLKAAGGKPTAASKSDNEEL